MLYCDLHTHSTASDGTTDPQDLPRLAKAAGLGALALTDHDTTEGLVKCAAASRTENIEFVPGIEVSADPSLDGRPRRGTLHILGLFVRANDSMLKAVSQRMKEARDSRNPAIIEKLRDLGVDVNYSEVVDLATRQGTKIIGRPHIASVLIAKGYARSMQDAFSRYLVQDGAAYVRRDRLAASNAIESIHHAGGLAILAHPMQLGIREPDLLITFIHQLRELGLDGIETRHSDHGAKDIAQFEQLADRFDLLTSGGSDFHGTRKSVHLGDQKIPIEVYKRLANATTPFRS